MQDENLLVDDLAEEVSSLGRDELITFGEYVFALSTTLIRKFAYDATRNAINICGLLESNAWIEAQLGPHLNVCYEQVQERAETDETFLEYHVGTAVRIVLYYLEERDLFPRDRAESPFLYEYETLLFSLEKSRVMTTIKRDLNDKTRSITRIYIDIVKMIKSNKEREALEVLGGELAAAIEVYLNKLSTRCRLGFFSSNNDVKKF